MKKNKFVDGSDGAGIKITTREGRTYDAADKRGHAKAEAERKRRGKIKPK